MGRPNVTEDETLNSRFFPVGIPRSRCLSASVVNLFLSHQGLRFFEIAVITRWPVVWTAACQPGGTKVVALYSTINAGPRRAAPRRRCCRGNAGVDSQRPIQRTRCVVGGTGRVGRSKPPRGRTPRPIA